MTTPFSARGLNQIITELFVDLKRRPLLRDAKRIRKYSPLKYAGACSHQIECVESRLLLTGSDSFAGRTNLGSVISITDTGTNVGFTAESGEPVQSGVVNSAWWTWTAPSNGTLVVDTIGSNFDTFLTLATGSAVDALSVVAQDDDGGGGVSSRIAASVTSGTAYQFAVDGFATGTGSITLNLTFATVSISPGVWTAQGPGPTINAQVTIPANNPVNGAIQTIATHPTNSDIMYVGTVNGGIWKTTNATTANTWTPLTDTLPSQSIGAIEFDVTDPTFNTLLAGTGRWSNYAEIGDDSGMLYYTTNGGTSWTVLSPALLANQKISAVAVRGNTWLVTSISGGVYRSTNGGATFTNINGLNGLGTGGTQDMVADPTSSNRFFVTMQGSGGIFRTDNAGATWTNVTGTVTGISGASRVRLAVNASAGAVYVAVGAGGDGAATRVWRSANQGGTWTQMDDVFVHNGGQQDPNTSLAADPTNANLVYVGGDRISASPFTGLSFRGNAAAAAGSQWSILVNAGASNTAPHADTRDMAFRADGTLLESDDGGMYRHTNPAGTGSWVAAAGNIAAIEAHNVAYNSLNNTLVIGTQDNGTHLQPTSGNSQWTFINGGDGGDVAVDTVTLAGNNQSIVYLSSQNLGGFRRVVYGSNNNFVSSTNLAGITDVNFTTPIELNTINPQRILIGGASALFESTNQGTTNTNIGGPGQPGFVQNAMVYGGSLNGTPNPDLIYVGAHSAVFK